MTGIFATLWITPQVTLPGTMAAKALRLWEPIIMRLTFALAALFHNLLDWLTRQPFLRYFRMKGLKINGSFINAFTFDMAHCGIDVRTEPPRSKLISKERLPSFSPSPLRRVSHSTTGE